MGHKSKIFNCSCFNTYLEICSLLFFIFAINTNLYSQTLTAEQIYEKVKDAVVVILAYDYSDELVAQGSGIVLNDKGYVVTNYHVLSGNERLEIMQGDEIIPYVDIIGIDVEKDILILKIEEKKFPAMKIGDVTKLKVGQRVYAIGSPLGFENTISEGIISGLRSYEELSKNYIQITASISPGSSGGAVVNDKGELIGISTSTIQEGQNLNFAVPIDDVFSVEINSYSKNAAYKDFEFFDRGVRALESGNYKSAKEFFCKFIQIFPENANAYVNRGYSNSKLGYYKNAIEDFSKAIEINPNNADAYNNRGVDKSKLEDYRGAIQDYSKAIEIDPNYVSAYINRGVAKSNLDDYKGAIQDYNKVIEISPYYSNAYYNRGNTKVQLNDYKGSIKDYNLAIQFDSNYSIAYRNRGLSKFNLGDKSGACLDWSKAGELGDYSVYDLIRESCN